MKTIHVSGKRKRAIARATIKQGHGKIRINNQLLVNTSPKMTQMKLQEPLILAGEAANHVDIDVNVTGGGIMGQADASRLVIAKALVAWIKDKNLENKFLKYDRHFLVADVRRKETRKPNDSKARAKRQKSYR